MSLVILIFIAAFLVYDLFQKRNKKKQENSNSNEKTMEQPSEEEPTSDTALIKEQETSDSNQQEDTNSKVARINEIVQKGLYGGEDKEKCLIEINTIINEQ